MQMTSVGSARISRDLSSPGHVDVERDSVTDMIHGGGNFR